MTVERDVKPSDRGRQESPRIRAGPMTCHPEGYKCLGDPLAEALGDSMVATDGNYSWRDLDPGYHRDLLYRAERVRKSLAARGLAMIASESEPQ